MLIEHIIWMDSSASVNGWNDIKDITCDLDPIHSFGFVIKETDDAIIVAPHYTTDKIDGLQQACGWMRIPKVSIDRRIVVAAIDIKTLTYG